MKTFRIATYNVNSIRSRLHIVIPWLRENRPDVLCMQETKVSDAEFPLPPFEEIGYHVAYRGDKRYNGVAVASLEKPASVHFGLDDAGPPDGDRLIRAVYSGITVLNSYVPQGRDRETEHFVYKLEWYKRLKLLLEKKYSVSNPLIWCGDLNVAPESIDVHDPKRLLGHVCFNPEVWDAFASVKAWGLTDIFRKHYPGVPDQYTFFDYRVPKSVDRKLGWRIDHILATPALAEKSIGCSIDLKPRLSDKPSDHTILLAEYSMMEDIKKMDEKMAITNINKSIERKFSSIEKGIASSKDPRELYETLLLLTSEEFEIPYIWFSFVDNPDTGDWMKQLESSELLSSRLNSVETSVLEGLIKNDLKPRLANDNLRPFYTLLPKNSKYFLKSLAVAPIVLNSTVIGSLNFGDSDSRRYSPDMDTTLLCGLAEKFSSILSDMLTAGKQE